MKIAFIGYGELGRQIHAFIQQSGSITEVIFFDDVLYAQKPDNAFPFASYSDEDYKDCLFIVALGYKHLPVKQKIMARLSETKRKIFSFVHPACFLNSSAIIKEGAFLYPMCNIDKDAQVGAGTLLNNSVVVSHNSVIGDCCYVSPGVVISGNVNIGACTFIGSGTVVTNDVKIGNHVVIGVGTVVTKDIPDNSVVIGNPMKFVNTLHLV
jgi:sugar O-acyltransferase (sialic acid O-acetyltransferase NeuD family)